jgi:hypothetical protein
MIKLPAPPKFTLVSPPRPIFDFNENFKIEQSIEQCYSRVKFSSNTLKYEFFKSKGTQADTNNHLIQTVCLLATVAILVVIFCFIVQLETSRISDLIKKIIKKCKFSSKSKCVSDLNGIAIIKKSYIVDLGENNTNCLDYDHFLRSHLKPICIDRLSSFRFQIDANIYSTPFQTNGSDQIYYYINNNL